MTEQDKHPNSKIITIRRSKNFLEKSQSVEIKDFFSSGIQDVGSYFESNTSVRIGSGLTVAEEKLLLPEFLGVHKDDRIYPEERNKFYMNIKTLVPDKGKQLEIGLSTDNSKPVSADNLPLKLEDYLRYRHAIGHKWVAMSEELAKGNQLIHFFIDDPVTATSSKNVISDLQDQARTYFLEIKSNSDKINAMLTLLGIDFRDIVGQTDESSNQMRSQRLREIADKDPKEFNNVYKNKNFDVNYDIQLMVNTGVLKVVGAKYLIDETGDAIGNFEETVEFMKDTKNNSQQIALLKAKLQEAVKSARKRKVVKEVITKRY